MPSLNIHIFKLNDWKSDVWCWPNSVPHRKYCIVWEILEYSAWCIWTAVVYFHGACMEMCRTFGLWVLQRRLETKYRVSVKLSWSQSFLFYFIINIIYWFLVKFIFNKVQNEHVQIFQTISFNHPEVNEFFDCMG